MTAKILILALAALFFGARAKSVAKYNLNIGRLDNRNGQCDNNQMTLENVPDTPLLTGNTVTFSTTIKPQTSLFDRKSNSCANECENKISTPSCISVGTARTSNSLPNRNSNSATFKTKISTPSCDSEETKKPTYSLFNGKTNKAPECENKITTPCCNYVDTTRRLNSLFSPNINLSPSAPECDTRTPICNSLTETVRSSNHYFNRNMNCESNIVPSCNPMGMIDLKSFLNRPKSESTSTQNCNAASEAARPSNSLINCKNNSPCDKSLSEVKSPNCNSVTSSVWKRPLILSGNACNEPSQPCSCNTEIIGPNICGTACTESISQRPLTRFFNTPNINLPCIENIESVSTKCCASSIDNSGTCNKVLNRPIFEIYPPVNNLPGVDNIRPCNCITETISAPCGSPCNGLGSCNCNRPFENYPVNNLLCTEINKIPENCQLVNRQQCVDNRPSCNSIPEIQCSTAVDTKPFNRPVFETCRFNNVNTVTCSLPTSCDTVDNAFITKLPNNPFNRPCLETASCNLKAGCNCNRCAEFSPCFQQGCTPLQAPTLPSIDTQVIPNCATTSVVDSSIVNSLTDSIQLLVIANLIQNSMYLNSLSGNRCLNTDVLGSVQCVLDSTPACADVVDACGCVGVDENCCNNFSPCNTCLPDICGACCPDYANFGCQGYPDMISSILNCREKPLPDVLSLLGCSLPFGDLGGQLGCSSSTNNEFCGCSTLPEVVTPFGGSCGFSGCNNLPQWSEPCSSNFINIPDGFSTQFYPQSFQGCNSYDFDGYSNLPQDSFMCTGIPDFQSFQIPYQPGFCFQNGIGGFAPDVNNCGLFSNAPDIQTFPQTCEFLTESLPYFGLPNVPNYGCNSNDVPIGCNKQEIITTNFINIPEVTCNQYDSFAYQGFSNPFANRNLQQNVPVAQILGSGLQEQIGYIEVTPNCNSNVQDYITPVAQSYITQSCQNEIPVIPAYFLPKVPVCSNTYYECLPDVIVSSSCNSSPLDSYEYPIELHLQQNADFGYALELPKQAEILIPSSMPAELWVDPKSLPAVYLSIDPTLGGTYSC